MRMTYDDFVKTYGPQIDAAYRSAHGVPPAITDQFHNAWRLLREGWGIDAVLADIKGEPYTDGPGSHPEEMLPPESPEVPVSAVVPLRADGRIFRTPDGAAWRWRGVSAFGLLNRYARGEDVSDFLNAYQGFNVLRVWPYVPTKDWGDRAWSVTDPAVIRAFVEDMNARGWYVELTLLTDDDPLRLKWAELAIGQIAGPVGLFVEAGNEPETHKDIQTALLTVPIATVIPLWTSGNYEDAVKMRGAYGVCHTSRDREWVRRAHDLLEFYNGGGPNAPSDPPHRFPIIADEPPKLQDVGASADDWMAYFAACSLLGGGATFHSETGKFGLPPTAEEAALAAAALKGLTAFPADAPLGAYSRLDDASLRTYIVGGFMVRIRPTGPMPSGWTALDDAGVLWKR